MRNPYKVEKTFEFNPGQTYYIQLEVNLADLKLLLHSEAKGIAAIYGLDNTGKINPADVLSDYDESEAYKESATQQAPAL